MGKNIPAANSTNHLFTVEILLENPSHTLAIAELMKVLNNENVKDFRIINGLELGTKIEEALQDHASSKSPDLSRLSAIVKKEKLQSTLFEEYIKKGTLIRLTALKDKGVKLSIPCRILNYDAPSAQITIYHVDEKRVYSFKLYEIEDLVAH